MMVLIVLMHIKALTPGTAISGLDCRLSTCGELLLGGQGRQGRRLLAALPHV